MYCQQQTQGHLMSLSSKPKIRPFDNRVVVRKSKKEFKEKYFEFETIGQGCFGIVTAGVRRSDSRPVAIKHIPLNLVKYMWAKTQNDNYKTITEVVLMAQLNEEVLIVMERPLKSMNIKELFKWRGGNIPQHEVKSIFKQLVDAAVLMHKNGIFHRDIKGENILVFRVQEELSIKIIDFGCGDILQKKPYTTFRGSLANAPPEQHLLNLCYAEQTTVWQIGALLWNLYSDRPFHTKEYMNGLNPPFDRLSRKCKDFMNQCLTICPKQRSRLVKLQCHAWLVQKSRPTSPHSSNAARGEKAQ
uniref:non-specific serine/threonine protein kinase n=1 Tax=Gouania willdenowi TaxID=441366 RepID=A0A8C5H5C3_GOUWI